MSRPRVLLTPDVETRPGRRGPWRAHFLDRAYPRAVLDAGGVPLVAPYSEDPAVLEVLLETVDAVVLTGGDFDVDPTLFGEEPHEKLGTLKADRTAFERAIYAGTIARGLPLLGICGGMQLICALRGGALWQDLGTQHPEALEHEQAEPKDEAGHTVEVVPGTRLAELCGAEELGVNSTHHQAVRELGEGLRANATAPDGIVEAFDDPAYPFLLAVQWHPEAMPGDRQAAIYRGLIVAAGG